MSQPCGMWPRRDGCACGKPAMFGWPSEEGGLVPICEDCIRWSGQKRQYLKLLALHPAESVPASTPDTPPEQETENG